MVAHAYNPNTSEAEAGDCHEFVGQQGYDSKILSHKNITISHKDKTSPFPTKILNLRNSQDDTGK